MAGPYLPIRRLRSAACRPAAYRPLPTGIGPSTSFSAFLLPLHASNCWLGTYSRGTSMICCARWMANVRCRFVLGLKQVSALHAVQVRVSVHGRRFLHHLKFVPGMM